MSLYGALASGVSGLNAGAQAMGIISDNISNLNTVGYKGTKSLFSTFVTKSPTTTTYSPGGVKSRPFQMIDTQGLLQGSDTASDLAVSGAGMFVVNEAATPTSGADYLFTRAGAFQPDKSGNLVNTAGYFLQGWATNTSGVPTAGSLTTLSQLETVNVATLSGTAQATTLVNIAANLPASAAVAATSAQTIQIYDSLGVAHNIDLTWTKAASNSWTLAVSNPRLASDNTTVTGATTAATRTITFNGDGTPNTIVMPAIAITTWTTGASNSSIALNVGTASKLDGLTQFSSNFSVSNVFQDGLSFGFFSGIDVDTNGLVKAIFDNGQSRFIYKIPLVSFANTNGLQGRQGNAFGETTRSGNPLINSATFGGTGEIVSGALEQSTVDLGAEVTNMIITQRAYSANATIITTADEMLEELIRTKR